MIMFPLNPVFRIFVWEWAGSAGLKKKKTDQQADNAYNRPATFSSGPVSSKEGSLVSVA